MHSLRDFRKRSCCPKRLLPPSEAVLAVSVMHPLDPLLWVSPGSESIYFDTLDEFRVSTEGKSRVSRWSVVGML